MRSRCARNPVYHARVKDELLAITRTPRRFVTYQVTNRRGLSPFLL